MEKRNIYLLNQLANYTLLVLKEENKFLIYINDELVKEVKEVEDVSYALFEMWDDERSKNDDLSLKLLDIKIIVESKSY